MKFLRVFFPFSSCKEPNLQLSINIETPESPFPEFSLCDCFSQVIAGSPSGVAVTFLFFSVYLLLCRRMSW